MLWLVISDAKRKCREMASICSVSSWIPEDDLILKNAVEAGASLEALAKGAVTFSHKFTVQELQDRWYSLLYDPTISIPASARMVDFELSATHLSLKSTKFGILKGSPQVPLKRKVESIRKHYYAMRKRLRDEVYTSSDPPNKLIDNEASYRDHAAINKELTDSLEAKSIADFNFMYNMGNVSSSFGASREFHYHISSDTEFQPMEISSPLRKNAFWKKTDNILANRMPTNTNLRNKIHNTEEASILTSNNGFSECSLNLADDENIPFMDIDVNSMDKTCYDNLNSLLLSSPNNSHEDDLPPVTEPKMLDTGTSIANTDLICTTNVDIQQNNCRPDVSVSSPATVLCTLNSEDEEIPCNDDIILPKSFPSSNEKASLSVNQKDCARELCLTNIENHVRPRLVSQISGPERSSQLFTGVDGQFEYKDCNSLARGSKRAKNTPLKLGHPKSYVILNSAISTALEGVMDDKSKELDVPNTVGNHLPLHAASNSSICDQEEIYSDDDDLPSYSDIESMILTMDLCQHDDDLLFNKEVSSYQLKETQQKIVRLEQAASSSLRRVIASKNAFAVLDGFHSRHFIKKPEVILGRSTEEIDVDIDLGKEGRANKISRRQASIKLEKDGSFTLRNIGKSLISVNGKEVAPRQLLKLDPNSLIEIRELRFMFEVNKKFISQYLANNGKNLQDNKGIYEWSP